MAETHYYGTGKRKSSVARVFMRSGAGEISINRRTFEDYFPTVRQQTDALQALAAVDAVGKFDLTVTVKGGGMAAQAQAMRHGIARALLDSDPELRPTLKKNGLLTRDAREKERKKYGQRGARARFQFSKR